MNERRSECLLCPEGVIRCVHFADVTLTLVDVPAYNVGTNCLCEHDNEAVRNYCITRTRGAGEPCDCGAVLEWNEDDAEFLLTTDSKAAAIAAFDDAERELLAVAIG